MRSRGETELATQWRDRYELCNQEKEELIEQVKMLQACTKTNSESLESNSPVNNHYSGHIMGSNDSFSIERAYMQLKDEYKVTNINQLCKRITLLLGIS